MTGSGLSSFANCHAFGSSCGFPISVRALSNFSFEFLKIKAAKLRALEKLKKIGKDFLTSELYASKQRALLSKALNSLL